MVQIKKTWSDSLEESEVAITLNWKGRLRVLFTGKVTLKKSTILYLASALIEMEEEVE